MRICKYCGLENADELLQCGSCRTDLPPTTLAPSDFKALKIKASDGFINRFLEVSPNGVSFQETALGGRPKKFGFHQIDLILLSASNVLSFQVGQEVFSLPTKPADANHQAAINHLVQEVQRTKA